MWPWGLIAIGTIGCLAVGLVFWATRKCAFTIEVLAPEMVQTGTIFEIHLALQNQTNRPATLDLISVDNSLLRYLELVRLVPNARSQATALGATAYSYERTLDVGEAMGIDIHLRAVHDGRAMGRVGVTDSRLLSVEKQVVINVEETAS